MREKALINLISCVLSVAIIIGSGIFAFSKLNEKEKEIAPEKNEEVTEAVTAPPEEKPLDEGKPVPEEQPTKQSGKSTVSTTSPDKPSDSSPASKSEDKKATKTKTKTTTTAPASSGEQAAKKEAGTLGFLWDSTEEVFYSAKDPWQRNFGYNALYDLAAPYIVLYYDTVRVKFNYGGYDWLIQFWKGQYGFVLLGAEVGVYYKEEGPTVEHYVCDDNNMRLKVGYTCYDKGEAIFTRKYQDTWWLTGFVAGKLDRFNDRSEMAMGIRITLKSSEMRDAFTDGLKRVGFKNGGANAGEPDTFYTNGNDVFLYWQNIAQ